MASILWGAKSGFAELFMTETWAGVAEFIGQLLGRGTELTPAFLDFASWRDPLWLSLDTIAMSVLAIGFAALAVLLTFLPAARNAAFGECSCSHEVFPNCYGPC
jgi:phosphonate transport system permease protein